MTELDQLRESNPLTNLKTVQWKDQEEKHGYKTISLTERSRMLILDIPLVEDYIEPDLKYYFNYLSNNISNGKYTDRALEITPYLVELIPYGVPATGLYKMIDTILQPQMDKHNAIVSILQAYTCCMAGWLLEDERFGRFEPRLIYKKQIPYIEHTILARNLAESIPKVDAEVFEEEYRQNNEKITND